MSEGPFFSVGKIEYEGPTSKNVLAFKYYNVSYPDSRLLLTEAL